MLEAQSHSARPPMMNALVYQGPNRIAWLQRPRPQLLAQTDAVVRITTTSICGTDLHILRGEVPGVAAGRVLGHEGVGVVEEVGALVTEIHVGDRVVISIISACGRCSFCRQAMPSHCRAGGWLLGNTLDGTQAEFVRVPFADNGLHVLPASVADESAVLLSCALPTGFECGVRCGHVQPGSAVAIVGAGPVGLATLLTAQLFSPADVFLIDLDDHRLEAGRLLGATQIINSSVGNVAEQVLALTGGAGVDVAIEAVGLPATFALCQDLLAAGGHLANVGVHSAAVSLQLERLWSANVTLTTRLVDGTSTAMLLTLIQRGRLRADGLISHHFALPEILLAYETFGAAARHRAAKVVLHAP